MDKINSKYFQQIWESTRANKNLSCPDSWDNVAKEWIERLSSDENYKNKYINRINATVKNLDLRNLLNKENIILDMGCALGLFTCEFAKKTKQAVGLDVSPIMIDYAKQNAVNFGLNNTEFHTLDINNLDIDKIGWRNKFDLVMACLTPAVKNLDDIKRMMQLSKKYCLHISFVETYDSIEEEIKSEVFNNSLNKSTRKNGHIFYLLLNILIQEGYFPETFYYTSNTEQNIKPNIKTVEKYADLLDLKTEEDKNKIHEFLKNKYSISNSITTKRKERYGYILWDVNEKRSSI